MKVRELIDALSRFDAEWEVITEGCDCYGDVGGVEESATQLDMGVGRPPGQRFVEVPAVALYRSSGGVDENERRRGEKRGDRPR